MWWCLGDCSLRFPYSYDCGLAAFEADFCVIEYTYGRKGSQTAHRREKRPKNMKTLELILQHAKAGEKIPKKRAVVMREFRHGDLQVLLCGIPAIRLGRTSPSMGS